MRYIFILLLSLTLAGNISARNFEIVKASNIEVDNRPVPTCLIAGGYADGLVEQESGKVFQITDNDTALVCFVIIDSLDKYEAVGKLNNLIDTTNLKSYYIDIEPTPVPDTLHLNIANRWFENESYLRSLYHYTKYLQLVDYQDEDILKRVKNCRKKAKQEIEQKNKALAKKSKYLAVISSKRLKFETMFELALYYFANVRYGASMHYLESILTMAPDNIPAKKLITRIQEITGLKRKDFGLINYYDTTEFKLVTISEHIPDPNDSTEVKIMPEMIQYQQPVYSSYSKMNNHAGVVWVRVLIDPKGFVADATINKTSGYQDLDESALEAAYYNYYLPGILDGKPVSTWVTYKVEFKLD